MITLQLIHVNKSQSRIMILHCNKNQWNEKQHNIIIYSKEPHLTIDKFGTNSY